MRFGGAHGRTAYASENAFFGVDAFGSGDGAETCASGSDAEATTTQPTTHVTTHVAVSVRAKRLFLDRIDAPPIGGVAYASVGPQRTRMRRIALWESVT